MDLLNRFLSRAPIAVQYAVGAGLVLVLAWALTLGARRLALRFGLLAPIRERDVHTAPVPRLGGVAIYLAVVLGMILLEPLGGARHDALNHGLLVPDAHLLRQFRGMLIGGTVAVLVGVLDDLVTLRPLPHFLGQILAAAAALATGLDTVQGISNPFSIHLFY